MAEIAPNSIFILIRGCPLDSDYTNSIYFSNSSAQISYFKNLGKYTLNNQQYQRHNKGVMRVSISSDELFDVNYCMFQNTAFGTKWFFAFVTDVEYVNNQCTNVYYEIDVLQTYYFDYELGETIVERETPASDDIGENLVPESIEFGDTLPRDIWEKRYGVSGLTSNFQIMIYSIPNQNIVYQENNPDLNPVIAGAIDRSTGLYTPCKVTKVSANDADKINETIRQLLLNQESIVQIFALPTDLANDTNSYIQNENAFGASLPKRPLEFNFNGESYHPRNNKMYTYPYMSLVVSNHQGATAEYRWENFRGTNVTVDGVQFVITGSANPVPNYMLIPKNYGIQGLGYNWDNGIPLGEIPTITWSEDSYGLWYANHGQSYIMGTTMQIATGGAAMLGGLFTGNAVMAVGGAASILGTATNAFKQITDLKNTPDSIKGVMGNSGALCAENQLGWSAYAMCIKPQMARVVDDFFTRFGYAAHVLKKPSIHNRSIWTYVKTIGCMIHAKHGTGLNAEAEKKICQIYDTGVTFWTSGTNVGNYNYENDFITI